MTSGCDLRCYGGNTEINSLRENYFLECIFYYFPPYVHCKTFYMVIWIWNYTVSDRQFFTVKLQHSYDKYYIYIYIYMVIWLSKYTVWSFKRTVSLFPGSQVANNNITLKNGDFFTVHCSVLLKLYFLTHYCLKSFFVVFRDIA